MELQAKCEKQDRQERAWKVKADAEREEEYKRSNAAKVFGNAKRSASVRMNNDRIETIPFFLKVQDICATFSEYLII